MSSLLRRLRAPFSHAPNYANPPFALRYRSNTLFIISTVGIGLFTDLFLYGLIVPILPFILSDRLHLPQSQIQSHVSGLLAAYAGASVLFSPVAGLIADQTSTRRAPFLLGLTALLAATVLFFLGQSILVLAVARVLQGMSAAVVWTIGLALCMDTVGPENLGKTIGSIFGFISIGSLAAPVVAGVLYEKVGYSGVLGVGLAMVALDFVMRLLVIEKRVAARYEAQGKDADRTADANGHANGGGNQDDAGLSQDGEDQEDEESPLLSKDDEKQYRIPEKQPWLIRKVPVLYCLKDSSLVTALLISSVQATLLSVFDATIPTESKALFNIDSLQAGLLFLPVGISGFFVGPIAGWAVDRFGTKPIATLGYLYLVPMLVLLRLPHAAPDNPKPQVIIYCVILTLCGAGLAVIDAPGIVESGAVVNKWHKANPDVFGEQGPYAQLYGLSSMVF